MGKESPLVQPLADFSHVKYVNSRELIISEEAQIRVHRFHHERRLKETSSYSSIQPNHQIAARPISRLVIRVTSRSILKLRSNRRDLP